MRRATRTALAVAVACTGLAACTGAPAEQSAPSTPAPAVPPVSAPLVAEPAAVVAPTVTRGGIGFHPSDEERADALAAASALSLEEVAGQVIVAAVSSPDPAAAADLVESRHLGGVILMSGAITDRAGVVELTEAVRGADGDRGWPLWIATDEEGGPVSRLSGVVRGMPAFMAAGAATDKDAVTAAYAGLGADLASLGIDVDFAPVADVTIGPADPIIRSRAAGADPEAVATTVIASATGLAQAGVVPVIKHFPGHGSVTTDSHHDLPVQSATVAQLEQRDLVPFADAIASGAPAVMVGHIAVPAWGDEPATLEPEAYAYLRERLGFDGVAITDALNMGAVTGRHPAGEASVRALQAGADVLLMPASVDAAIDAIVAAVEDGTLSRARLDEAAARGIVLMRWAGDASRGGDDASDDYARALAAAGAVVASDRCEGPLIDGRATVVAGPEAARATLTTALEAAGVEVGDGGPTIALVSSGRVTASADVVVSLGEPWGLAGSSAEAYVGLFGSTASSVRGLADVLTGAVEPGGAWPVPMDGLPATC